MNFDTLIEFERQIDGQLVTGLRSANLGNNQKPIVVFFHGNGFNARSYQRALSRVSEEFDLLCPHVQGHGATPEGDHFLGWQSWSRLFEKLVIAEVQHTDQPVIAIGHSWGGVMATLIADRSPTLFNHLSLLDPIYLPRSMTLTSRLLGLIGVPQLNPMVKKTLKRRILFDSNEHIIKSIAGRGVFAGWDDECLADYAEYCFIDSDGHRRLATPTWIEAAIYGSYSQRLYSAVKELSVDVDLYYGMDTYPQVIKLIKTIAERNSSFNLIEKEGGHCFPMQSSAAFADELYNQINNRLINHLAK